MALKEYFFKWTRVLLLAASPILLFYNCHQKSSDENFLFAYFTGNGEDGLHLAASTDGLHWQALNNGNPFLAPLVGKSCLMRDPCIAKGRDGTFHMVWTTSWNGKGIGHASSKDLVHWSVQQNIPVMADEPNTLNCWAPEINYIPADGQYIIYWSSTIPDKFPETANSTASGNKRNHRIYYTLTKDFKSFEPSKLLYDPGFNAIDASIYDRGNGYVMFLKNETELPRPEKNLHTAYADKITGPWSKAGPAITGDYWAEGPTAIKINDQWHMYFDQYRKHRFGLVVSDDLEHWKDISGQLTMPQGIRHGTVFSVDQDLWDKLHQVKVDLPMLYRDDSRKGRPYAKDPSVVKFADSYFMYYSLPPHDDDGQVSGEWNIGIATSNDMEHWKKAGEIKPEAPYESNGLCAPGALVHDGKVHLFYQTYGNREKDAICHAWSEDGLHFDRDQTNPVFSAKGSWNIGRAIDADVFVDGDSAYLYFATRDPEYKQQLLGVAVSPLDKNFARNSWRQPVNAPLLKPEMAWEMNCIEAPSVFKQHGKYYMFYAGAYNHEGQQIGLATSEDALHWQRFSDQPVLTRGDSTSWNATESGHPGVFADGDGKKWLFFQGNPDNGYTYYLSRRQFEITGDGKVGFFN